MSQQCDAHKVMTGSLPVSAGLTHHGVTHALVVSPAGHGQRGVGLHPDQRQICRGPHQCAQAAGRQPGRLPSATAGAPAHEQRETEARAV